MKNISTILLITATVILSGCRTVSTQQHAARINTINDETRAKFAITDREFYKKYLDADGLAIVTSEKVPDAALFEAEYIINKMLKGRDDIRQAIIKNKVHVAIMAHDEYTTDIPEHSTLKSAPFWDKRARGLGATKTRPVVTCGAENLLNYQGDKYEGQNILVHEFAHVIYLMGLKDVDPVFDRRLWDSYYKNVKEKGKWKNTYAGSNRQEYFAEGVMNWFNCNKENDRLHNHVNTRIEMKQYDPELSALLTEVFGDNDWSFIPAIKRENHTELVHLNGYDFDDSPEFKWPVYLERLNDKGLVEYIDEKKYQKAASAPKPSTLQKSK